MAYYCSNCREPLPSEDALKKIAVGEARNVILCKTCHCYVTLEDKNPRPEKK